MKRDILRIFKKHTSTLLCVAATGGIAVTAILTAKSTPKAMSILEKAREDKGDPLTIFEKVEAVVPCYIPAIVSGVVTSMCIFGANVLNKKQQASLMSAYALLSTRYKRYTDKIRETYGDEVHKAVLNSIAVEQANDIPVHASTVYGKLQDFDGANEERRLFYDAYSERYFESTISHVLQAEYHLNRNFSLGGDVTLNDFYLFLGIDKIEGGDDIGWFWGNYELPWIDFENIPMKLEDGTSYYMILTVFGPEPQMDDSERD